MLQGDALSYGVLLGCFGVGAVAGAFLSAAAREAVSTEWVVRGAFMGFAFCAIICASSHTIWLTGVGLLVGGACWVLALSLFNVTVQLSTPRWVVGRSLALYQTATFGGMALGSWMWGLAADRYGVSFALELAGLCLLAGVLAGLLFPMPPLKALNRWRQPNLALNLQPRSGPIFIVVDWIIEEANLPAFLTAMDRRRRMRLRDGAVQWELMRDLENPRIWRETYHAPTWVEYVRLNQRATHADAEVGEALRALHAGDGLPKVQRMIVRPTNWEEAVLALKPTDLD